MDSLHFWTARW